MVEEKPKEEQQDTASKDIPNIVELVTRAEKANAESRELLTKHEEIYKRHNELIARKLIGGGTDATPQPDKKEETAAEYAKRVAAGK